MIDKTFFLYKIVNSVNDKVYIGMTSRPKGRFKEHFSKSSSCTKLKRAINKHGKDNFEMILLCEGLEEYILDLEVKAIQAYDSIENGYNLVLGHPNTNGSILSEEMKGNISKGLLKYYESNVSKNKGAMRLAKRDLNPYYVMGFWFPDKRVACESLNMNEKSFYKWRSDGTLGDACHPVKNSTSHSPIYVLGFWFDSLITATATLKKTKEFLQRLIRKDDVEEKLLRIGTKVRTVPPINGYSVIIEGQTFSSIAEASRNTPYTTSMIKQRLKNKTDGFSRIEVN